MKLNRFDVTRYLGDEEAIAEYLSAVLEENDPELYLAALGDVAKARGMSQVAAKAGLGRESLYKALAPGANPRFDTIMRVTQALGVRYHAIATPARAEAPIKTVPKKAPARKAPARSSAPPARARKRVAA